MAAKENIEFVRIDEPHSPNDMPTTSSSRVTLHDFASEMLGEEILHILDKEVVEKVFSIRGMFAEQDRSSDIDALMEKVDTNIKNLRRNAAEIAELRATTRAILAGLQAER